MASLGTRAAKQAPRRTREVAWHRLPPRVLRYVSWPSKYKTVAFGKAAQTLRNSVEQVGL